MAITTLSDLPPGPLMAVDPGSKTLGLAVCDAARWVVTPLETIERAKFTRDAERLFAAYDGRGCAGLVLGLPVHMDGRDSRAAQSARSLATNLLRLRDIPIAYQDERLSTAAAEARLREAGVTAAGLKAKIDAQAAALILEAALDALRREAAP